MVTDSVAQLVEQYTFNVWVLGSNPSRVTSEKFPSRSLYDETVFFCLRGEIGRHAILRGWFPMDVLVRVQSQARNNYKTFLIINFQFLIKRLGSSAGRAIHF